MEKTAKISIN